MPLVLNTKQTYNILNYKNLIFSKKDPLHEKIFCTQANCVQIFFWPKKLDFFQLDMFYS